MTTISPSHKDATPTNLLEFIRRSSSLSRALTALTIACATIAVLALLGVFADPRQVLGQPVWAKTTKFSISIALYGASMLWILGLLKDRAPRAVRVVSNAIAATLGLEMILLITQAIRGRAMHFNIATPLDTALWSIMGFSIVIFWGFALVTAIVMLFQRLESRSLTLSLRLGLIVVLIGFAQGFLMTGPNNLQMSALQSGQKLDLVGAHTVNAIRDGGPGIPFLGWSTDHGDLRVGHFIGIHAIQLIPLLGLFLMRRRESWLTESHRVGLVWVGAIGYLGLVGLATLQALRDQSIIAPDALTITAFSSLIGVVLIACAAIVTHARATARA
jgi:hypothetical protein